MRERLTGKFVSRYMQLLRLPVVIGGITASVLIGMDNITYSTKYFLKKKGLIK